MAQHMQYVLTRVSPTMGSEDYLLDLDYDVAPYDPGNSYGPPENCAPPSGGEIERLDITCEGKPFEVTDPEQDRIELHIYENHDYNAVDEIEDGW